MDDRKTIAIVQSRMGSKRLPGKMKMVIGDRSILGHVFNCLTRCSKIDKIVLATSTDSKNKDLEEIAQPFGVETHFGPEDNVLERFQQVVAKLGPEWTTIVRICGDSPFLDYEEIDKVITAHHQGNYDLSRNYCHPKGMSCGAEVISRRAFEESCQKAETDEHREHVDEWILQHPHNYRIFHMDVPPQKRGSRISFAIDTQEDLNFMRNVVRSTPSNDGYYRTEDLLGTVKENPHLLDLRKLKVVVRVDGDGEIGMGAVLRAVTVCTELKKRYPKSRFTFISNREAHATIRNYGFNSEELNGEKVTEEEIRATINKINPDIIITDLRKYLDDASSESLSNSLRVRFIDSEIKREVRGNLIFNSLPIQAQYKDTVYHAGLHLMPLREEFNVVRKKVTSESPKNALVLLGGGEHGPQLKKILQVIQKIPEVHFTMILGPGMSQENVQDLELSASSLTNITLKRNVRNVKELMEEADLGISGGGNVLYEFARCGVPTLTITTYYDHEHDDHQQHYARAFEEAGTTLYVGHGLQWNESEMTEQLQHLANNELLRTEMSLKGQQLVDGNATELICNEIIATYLQ